VLWTWAEDCDQALEHEAGEGDKVQTCHGLGQSLEVAGQAPEACRPGEAALDHPPSRQEHEATLGPKVLDHLQLDAVRLSLGRRMIPGVASVDVASLTFSPVASCTASGPMAYRVFGLPMGNPRG
jgi:hypothetical protein